MTIELVASVVTVEPQDLQNILQTITHLASLGPELSADIPPVVQPGWQVFWHPGSGNVRYLIVTGPHLWLEALLEMFRQRGYSELEARITNDRLVFMLWRYEWAR
jgi:hypothetical protein